MNFKEIKGRIKKIPISSVLEVWEPSCLEGKCCFHKDENAGSFKYKDDAEKGGIFKCFCCGATGDKTDFVARHDGVDFKEATLRIATKFDVIDSKTYEQLSEHPIAIEATKTEYKPVKKVNEAKRKNDRQTDRVYSLMRDMLGLKDGHREYLLSRGVEEDQLSNYFSIRKLDDYFFQRMKERFGLIPEDFIGIPGFYLENGKIASKDIEGIAIPMHNAEGNITSLQVRRDKITDKKHGARYIFFSSSKLEQGCSSGAQVDIVNPDYSGSYFITEGHFKALELQKHFGVSAISVQGVNNVEPLKTEIPALLEKHPIRRFIIAYDADMVHNKNVKKAAMNLKDLLESFNIPTGFMIWDEQYGKGADDVILSGNAEHFKFVRDLEGE